MYLLYHALTALSVIVLAPYYAWRARRRGEPAARVRERLGYLPAAFRTNHSLEGRPNGSQQKVVWIHAVSVGEVLAAVPLIAGLTKEFRQQKIFVSTTTETGQALAKDRLAGADGVFFFPFDSAGAVRRALRTIQPDAVIIMETEIWPNFLREAQRAKVPVVFASARISDRSLARFRRWQFLIEQLFRAALRASTLFLAQTPEDAAKLVEMGAAEEQVTVAGNLKYDMEPPPVGKFGEWMQDQIRSQDRWPVLVAGSVLEGEEESVLAAYDIVQRKFRRSLLLLAPRKPARFAEAGRTAANAGWKVAFRSSIDLGAKFDEEADVVLLDSIGELAGLYALGDVVFVGGSLVAGGGHNILEPARFAKPPVFGPSMDNFREMAAQFLEADAGIQVASGSQLGRVWLQLIEKSELRERMGRTALELSNRNRGATERSVRRIAAILRAETRVA